MFRGTRTKVVLFRTAILAFLLFCCGWVLFRQFSQGLQSSIDNALRCQGEYAAYLLAKESESGRIQDLGNHVVSHKDLPAVQKLIRILGPSGKKLYEWGPENFKRANGVISATGATRARACMFETVSSPAGPMRLASLPVGEGPSLNYIVQVGVSLSPLRDSLTRITFLLILVGLVILTVVTVGGGFLTDLALEPMRKMGKGVRKIGMGNIRGRLEVPRTGDEMEELGLNFNTMLERLEKTTEQMCRFTADASHQLRTPLTIMKGEIEVALRKTRSAADQEQVLRSVLEEIDHLWKIVNDLLTLARADSEIEVLAKDPVDLDEVLREVSETYGGLAENAGCSLEVLTRPGTIISGDKERLTHLLGNLVDNAIKYSPQGGAITVAVKNQGDIQISIRDSGMGIPAEDLPRIFERFHRSSGHNTRRVRGSGLGLSICQWIAKGHGGSIQVQSQIGKGSEFTVSLPRPA